MNNKIVFNFKSNWFDTGIVSKINIEGLWVYFNIRKFKLQYSNDICVFNLDLLHKQIQQYYKSNNRKYSVNSLREIIFQLKRHKIINFDRKYNMKNSNDLCYCKLLDLPSLGDKYKPLSDDDYYITVDTDTINKIFEIGLNEKHLITYYCLKKYINVQESSNGKITLSYKKMGQWLGINKETANTYAIELEKNKIIANEYTKSQAGHKCNSFILTTNKNLGQDSTVNEIAEKNNIKRLKKKLQNNKIKVTIKAFDGMKEYIDLMTQTEKDHINKLHKKHITYAIEYFYFELLDDLKERKKDKDNFINNIEKENGTEVNHREIIENNIKEKDINNIDDIVKDYDFWEDKNPFKENNKLRILGRAKEKDIGF